jgi:hypothetical protein
LAIGGFLIFWGLVSDRALSLLKAAAAVRTALYRETSRQAKTACNGCELTLF